MRSQKETDYQKHSLNQQSTTTWFKSLKTAIMKLNPH